LELCPCTSKDELTARERHYVQTINCVNRNIPGRTQQEYYQDNHELILEKKKTFDQAHKDQKRAYYQANKATRKAYALNYYYQKIKIL
jgi:hypothetical protein